MVGVVESKSQMHTTGFPFCVAYAGELVRCNVLTMTFVQSDSMSDTNVFEGQPEQSYMM